MFHMKLRQELGQRGARPECLNFRFEDSPEGTFIETIIAAQGQLEREQNSRQVKQKMKARLKSGYAVFAAPRGYKYEKVAGHGRLLVRDEPAASILQEALEGFACGRFETQVEVKRFLESQPHWPKDTPKGEVRIQRVRGYLTRIVYAGYLEYAPWKIDLTKGHHEPIIDLDTYEKIQARLTSKAKAAARADLNLAFPLRGFVLCSECDRPLTSCWSKGRHKHYPYYQCYNRECARYGRSIRKAEIEGAFLTLLKNAHPGKKLVRFVYDMMREAWEFRMKQGKVSLKALKQQISDVEAKIERMVTRCMETTNQTLLRPYEERITDYEMEKVKQSEQLEKTRRPASTFERTFRTALAFFVNPLILWEKGAFEHKRMVLKTMFADRLAYDREKGFGTANLSLPFKLLQDIQSQECKMVGRAGLEPATKPL